jgi:hypothetical protein
MLHLKKLEVDLKLKILRHWKHTGRPFGNQS